MQRKARFPTVGVADGRQMVGAEVAGRVSVFARQAV
jgi:hypothetical protein